MKSKSILFTDHAAKALKIAAKNASISQHSFMLDAVMEKIAKDESSEEITTLLSGHYYEMDQRAERKGKAAKQD